MSSHILLRLRLPLCMCVLCCICVFVRERCSFGPLRLSLGLCVCLAVCGLGAVSLPRAACLPCLCFCTCTDYIPVCLCCQSCIYTGLYRWCESEHDSMLLRCQQLLSPSGSLALLGRVCVRESHVCVSPCACVVNCLGICMCVCVFVSAWMLLPACLSSICGV